MSSWQAAALGDIAEVFNGKTPSKEEQRGAGHPVLKIKDVNEHGEFRGTFESFVEPRFAEMFTTKQVRNGDTLVLNAAHNAEYVGSKTYQAQPPTFGALATGEWLIVRPAAEKLHPGYANHWMNSSSARRAIREMVKGIHLYPKDVARLRVPLPPLPEQRRIAEILDKADALRAKRRAALAQLDTLTQSIFLDMFGDAGENTKAWQVRRVSEFVAAFQGGKSLESESGENVVTRNRVLKVSAVTGMTFLAHESKPVPDSYTPPVEHFVRAGDLLFSRANTTDLVGAVAYVERTPQNLLLPDKLWRFVWKRPALVEPLFVWALFQTPALRQEIGRRATGTSGSMKNISQEKVLGISTICPPMSIQRDFTRRLSAVEGVRAGFRASAKEIDALFTSVQHRAFGGEL